MDSNKPLAISAVIAVLGVGPWSVAVANDAAQRYPDRPIRLIVGYTPGGNNDIIARVVAKDLSEALGQPVIVENKPGAAARIAADYVANAEPDGYTLMVGATGPMVYAPGLYSDTRYDPIKNFRPITLLGSTPLVFAVNPKVPAASMKALVELAKAAPMHYAHGAAPFYVAAEGFRTISGLKIDPVAYKGNVQAVMASVSGEVPIVVADVPTLISQIESGGLRALAVTSETRSRFLSDVPSLKELGWSFSGISWTGLFAPAKTPDAIIDRLYDQLVSVLSKPSMQARLVQLRFETDGVGMPPSAFGEMHKKDLAYWSRTIKSLGIAIN